MSRNGIISITFYTPLFHWPGYAITHFCHLMPHLHVLQVILFPHYLRSGLIAAQSASSGTQQIPRYSFNFLHISILCTTLMSSKFYYFYMISALSELLLNLPLLGPTNFHAICTTFSTSTTTSITTTTIITTTTATSTTSYYYNYYKYYYYLVLVTITY